MRDAAAVERLIPHRPPFRFVDQLLSHDDSSAKLRLSLAPDDPRLSGGRLPALFLVEALTQAAAAFHGAARQGGAEAGMLVEVTKAALLGDGHGGDLVALRVQRGPMLGPLVRFTGEASVGGRVLVQCEFTVARA